MHQLIAAHQALADAMLACPGIQGLGIGTTNAGAPCLVVYVQAQIDGVPVRWEVGGVVAAAAESPPAAAARA